MQLFQVTRSQYITFNQEFRIQYISLRGGKSEWIISRRNGKYFSAIDHAATFEDAKAKFYSLAKVGA